MSPLPRSDNLTINALDGLRAMAALAVFGVHFQQLTAFQSGSTGPFELTRLLINGNTGVALFFTLSGFLLSMPYWQAKQGVAPQPLLFQYWLRRLVRIVPAYYVCLTVLIIHNGYWRSPEHLDDVITHYTFVFNYFDGYFFSINPPFWTIAVEMQFYVLLPLLFLALAAVGRRSTSAVIAGLAVLSYVAHVWIMESAVALTANAEAVGLHQFEGSVLSRSVVAHLPHFLIGVVAGQFHTQSGRASLGNHRDLGWGLVFWCNLSAVLLILATPIDNVLSLSHGRYNLPIVPLALALMIVSAPRSRIARLILDCKPVKWIGVVSYGVYLFHLPLQKIIAKGMPHLGMRADENWLIFGLVSLAVTVALASVSFVYFERPIMRSIAKKRQS